MKKNYDIESLINRFKQQDKIALARLITLIENDPELAIKVFKHFENIKHDAHIVGITGSPGKWPWKNGSLMVTFFRPTIRSSGTSSMILSTRTKGYRCGRNSMIFRTSHTVSMSHPFQKLTLGTFYDFSSLWIRFSNSLIVFFISGSLGMILETFNQSRWETAGVPETI